MIVSGSVKIDFSMSVKSDKPAPEKVEIDAEGDMVAVGSFIVSDWGSFKIGIPSSQYIKGGPDDPLVKAQALSQELSDTTALQILGVLLEDKNRRKKEIVKALNIMGVEQEISR